MLRKPGISSLDALQRATDAAERAHSATDEETRDTWLGIERGWLRLAASYDLTDRIASFVEEHDRRSRKEAAAHDLILRLIRAQEEALRKEPR